MLDRLAAVRSCVHDYAVSPGQFGGRGRLDGDREEVNEQSPALFSRGLLDVIEVSPGNNEKMDGGLWIDIGDDER